ncbi:hypothetical protein CBS101457_000176 [Exobasidium rhododendri]|nr:hypothetical protein CBS101457_000176 [Exobasidium rhododendri]
MDGNRFFEAVDNRTMSPPSHSHSAHQTRDFLSTFGTVSPDAASNLGDYRPFTPQAHTNNHASTSSEEHLDRPRLLDATEEWSLNAQPLHPSAPLDQQAEMQPSSSHQVSQGRDWYRYVVDKHFPWTTLEDRVYKNLSKEQKFLITDRIQEIRPYVPDTIRDKLYTEMDVPLATALLGDDISEMEAAVQKIFPIDQQRRKGGRGAHFVPWMTGLTNAQRREFVETLARVLKRGADDIRDLLLRRQVSPKIIQKFLHAHTPEHLVQLAEHYQLVPPSHRRGSLPWQEGTSAIQRRAIIQRLMSYGFKKRDYCYEMFQKPFIPPGYGLELLKASDAEFRQMLQDLKPQTQFPEVRSHAP